MDVKIAWDGLNRAAWGAALAAAPYSALQQDWAYGEVLAQCGGAVRRAAILLEGAPVGCAQFQIRRRLGLRLALCLRGPVWREPVAEEAKIVACRLLKRTFPESWPRVVLLMPESDDRAALARASCRRVVTGYHTVHLDLTQPEEALVAQLEGKWRNRLRAAQRAGLTVEATPGGWLLEAEREQAQRIGYAGLDPRFVTLYRAAGGGVLALQARRRSEVVAGVLALIHGAAATYHIGHSSETGRRCGAHNLLLWELARRLKARGLRTFDLGGVTSDAPGIAHFKLGMGGRLISLPGTYC